MDIIFEPLEFKNLSVKNRIFRSNISGRFDNYDGSGNQARINWELKFARGGVGAIISSFVPVTIQGAVEVYNRDRPWTLQPGRIRVVISEPIPAHEVAEMSSAELQDRVVQAIALEFEKPLDRELPAKDACIPVEATT